MKMKSSLITVLDFSVSDYFEPEGARRGGAGIEEKK